MKIVFGITNLKLGGAERVLVDIANELCNRFDVTIFTLYSHGEFEKELNNKIKRIYMYDKTYDDLSIIEKKKLSLNLVSKRGREKIYNKYLKDKFDVEIAFLEGPVTWIFSTKSSAKKIAWVHNDIKDVFGKKSKSKIKLSEKCYDNFNKIIFVSKDNLKSFENIYTDNKVPKKVIYNYLNSKLVIEKSNKEKVKDIDKKEISLVQVSRLVDQKAVGRLIDVHNKLINDGYKHKIYVIGDGPLENELNEKVNALGLSNTFKLLGKRTNPYPYIKEADYFILTSYYEGYPMVLLEAKVLNKYILITDSAARETLIDYDNKLIVDNNEIGIYDGIKTLIENKPKVNNNNKYDNKKIIDEIIDVIKA